MVDCVVGVSGGKDSMFQVLYMRDKMKLRPLLLCSEPCSTTEIGARNLENIKSLGFDTATLSANKELLWWEVANTFREKMWSREKGKWVQPI